MKKFKTKGKEKIKIGEYSQEAWDKVNKMLYEIYQGFENNGYNFFSNEDDVTEEAIFGTLKRTRYRYKYYKEIDIGKYEIGTIEIVVTEYIREPTITIEWEIIESYQISVDELFDFIREKKVNGVEE